MTTRHVSVQKEKSAITIVIYLANLQICHVSVHIREEIKSHDCSASNGNTVTLLAVNICLARVQGARLPFPPENADKGFPLV